MRRVTSASLVRWAGFAGIVGGAALIAAQLCFWLVVPDSEEVRRERQPVVFTTAVLWLVAHALLAPAIAGVYHGTYRRVGPFGGAGAVMAFLGTLGLFSYAFFLFPELIGFRPETVDEAQIAVALQATGELGAMSLLGGLFLFCVTLIVTRAFTPAAPSLIVAGSLVAPFGLLDLGWLALGAALVGSGVMWMGFHLATGRTAWARADRPVWPRPERNRQFRF